MSPKLFLFNVSHNSVAISQFKYAASAHPTEASAELGQLSASVQIASDIEPLGKDWLTYLTSVLELRFLNEFGRVIGPNLDLVLTAA